MARRGRSSLKWTLTSMSNRSATLLRRGRVVALEGEAVELELDPLEEHAVDVVGVLLGVDDVAAVAPHEVGDRGDDAGAVGAGQNGTAVAATVRGYR